MTTTVKYQLAKLLREKGFWGVFNLYSIETKKIWTTCYLGEDEFEKNYPAPTIAEVVMWLYKKHGIWINVKPSCDGIEWYSEMFTATEQVWDDLDKRHAINSAFRKYDSIHGKPTEAYEAAIEYVLTHLIKTVK